MSITDTAQPDAVQQPDNVDANRTAGAIPEDAGKTMTQAQIDAIVQNRLAEERQRNQTKYGDLDELSEKAKQLDEQKQAELSENEKLQQQIKDLEAKQVDLQKQADTERLNTMRLRIGQEAGLSPLQSARLQGADEDSLKGDAEAVKADLAQRNNALIPPDINATAGGEQSGIRRAAVGLSAEQKRIADDNNIPYDDYAKSLQQFEV